MTENAKVLNDQAIRLAHSGSVQEALACFKRAITIESDNYLIWYNFGITYRDAGMLKNAKEALFQAYQLCYAQDDDVVESLANVCVDSGENYEALLYCQDALENNEHNPRIWNLIGVISFKLKCYDIAVLAFENAISVNPYYYDALYNLRDAYRETKNYKGAAEIELRLKDLTE